MSLLKFKSTLLQSPVLFRVNDKLLESVVVPLTRYTTDERRQKDDKKLAKKVAAKAGEPEFFKTRDNIWTELKRKYDKVLTAKEQQLIKVTLLDGKIVEGFSWEITPFDVAKGIGNALASEVYVAKINDNLWDLERCLEIDCKIELLKFESHESKAAFWVTAACTLAEALERIYGCLVCNISSSQTGFFVEIHLKNKTITRKDIAEIDEVISKILINRVKVERIEASKNDALELFAYNQFKLQTIKDIPGDLIPIYRIGSYIDVSNSPFTRHNKKINAIKILKVETVLSNAERIQRIHGIAFPSAAQLKEFLKKNKLT